MAVSVSRAKKSRALIRTIRVFIPLVYTNSQSMQRCQNTPWQKLPLRRELGSSPIPARKSRARIRRCCHLSVGDETDKVCVLLPVLPQFSFFVLERTVPSKLLNRG